LLRSYRSAAGLSQEELAERAGLSRRGISDLERGARRTPYPATARRLAQALCLDATRQEVLLAATRPPGALDSGVATGSLPSPLSSFVGREKEVAEVRRLLETTRLLTLTGAGGVGKTRLALRVAAEVAAGYTHGVWLVDLAPLAEPALVPKAVASALDVHEQPHRLLVDTLADALRRRDLLLVLDNCEHLIQACAELVGALLPICSRLHVLTTSRQATRIAGETAWWVPSLQLPLAASPTAAQVAEAEAVKLFVERARAVQPGFVLTDRNAEFVVQVCRNLDGIPLALELAAARLSVLSPEQIAARLDDRFRLLTGGSLTALPRQQTLRGTLDWSYDLLSELERILLQRLAVFAGACTLEAAEAVCAGEGLETDQVIDLLAGLVSKSMVVVVREAEEVRYRLVETVRQYAWEKLRAAGEDQAVCRRHLEWCLTLAEEAEPRLYRAEQVQWLDRLEREHDNLRVALAWSHRQPDGSAELGRLVRALGWFWYLHGHLTEGQPWLEQAVSEVEPAGLRAGALLAVGWLAYGRGEYEHASDLLRESLVCGRASGEQRTTALTLTALSFTLRDRGDRAHSRPLLDESLAISRAVDFRWGIGFSLYLMSLEATWRVDYAEVADLCAQCLPVFRELGERYGLAYTVHELARVAWERGDGERAEELELEALVLSRELGNRRGICFALDGLARGVRQRGDYARAGGLLRQALVLWQELGNRHWIARSMAALAAVAAAQHQPERAARLGGAAEAQRKAVGAALSPDQQADSDAALAGARAELGERTFMDAWAAGLALSWDEAADEALATETPKHMPSSRIREAGAHAALVPLSQRERDVAVLVAQGRSNREIAEALVIAPRTAGTHVGNILTRLGLHTRAQIAAWVVEHGLSTAHTD
jgi:predicted ATPase/DNA-binding CsgD family transcriptional regulator